MHIRITYLRRGIMVSAPTQRPAEATDDNFHWMTREEERSLFDERVRQLIGISGDEFLRRVDTGYYDGTLDDIDHSDLMYLSMLSYIAR